MSPINDKIKTYFFEISSLNLDKLSFQKFIYQNYLVNLSEQDCSSAQPSVQLNKNANPNPNLFALPNCIFNQGDPHSLANQIKN